MIDIKKTMQDIDLMKDNIRNRNMTVDVDDVISLYEKMTAQQREIEDLQAQANKNAKKIQGLSGDERSAIFEAGKALKTKISTLNSKYVEIEKRFNESAKALPNWTSQDVPIGNTDEDNLEIFRFMEPTNFDFQPQDHISLGNKLELIDFDAGAKVAGSKFYFLKNEAVLLQHALKSFAFSKAMEFGFTPLQTPDVARNNILEGVGFAPRGESSNTYEIKDHDLSLIATAEIAVGGLHSQEVLREDSLPLLYVAESHCFRTEAGSGGQASKGLYRVHQFEKIELFAFTTPEQSEVVHEKIRELEESIYQDLNIPYRVVLNCTGDLGAPAFKKYDIEAWMPGKGETGEYGEVTSASNCTDYQSRRLDIKYRCDNDSKNKYVHTLNGTATALSRTILAIIENYQTSDGGVLIPDCLKPYLGMDMIKPKSSKSPVFSRKF